MSEAVGYSLWLVPEKDSQAYRLLSKYIQSLAVKHKSPLFEPHITLLGGIQDSEENIRKKTLKLLGVLTSLEIHTRDIGSCESYFQALFLKVALTKEILQTYEKSRQYFALPKKEYFPHLSIAYGEFSQDKTRLFRKSLTIPNFNFSVKTIELWRTEGSVDQWEKIETLPLGL